MEFSVVTPCSNRDLKRINNLWQTLRQQTDHDFEWIVACHHPQRLDTGLAKQARVVVPKGETAGDAERAAINKARGNYVIFAAADDYLMPGALRQLSLMIKDYPQASFDLNHYPTYEPRSSFMKTVRLKHLTANSLPDYGGKGRGKINVARHDPNADQRTVRRQLLRIAQGWGDSYRYFNGALHLAGKTIPRKLALRFNDAFSSDNYLYPDLTFAALVLQKIGRYRTLPDFYYVRVHHNDAINDPSLHQIRDQNRGELLIKAEAETVNRLRASSFRQKFERYTLEHLSRYLYDRAVHPQDFFSIPNNPLTLLKSVSDYLLRIQHRFSSMGWFNNHIFKLLRERRFAKAKNWMKRVVKLREWHRIVQNHGRGITKHLYFTHYLKQPVNPRVILFESFLGRNFSDSPKYVYLALQKRDPKKYRYVWIADQQHLDQVKRDVSQFRNTIVVPRFGFRYMKYLATAKYFVFNMRQPKWFVKRPGTRFVETWHGTPLKHLVFDMKNVASASVHYKTTFYHQSRQWDRLVTDNQFSYRVFKRAFMYPQSKMLKSGYPRNDVLYAPDRQRIARRVKRKLGIPQDKKVILYAPTWRDNEFVSHGHYHFDLRLNVNLLKRYLSDDYVLVLRTHYFITNQLKTSQFGSFVYDASNYDDISQLYLITDVLITDYSSVFFDFANLKRPILFYVYDYDTYAKVLRGFYLNMKRDLPGPLIKTSWGLVYAIQNLSKVKQRYHDRYQKFNQRFNAWDDGHASVRVVKALLQEKQ